MAQARTKTQVATRPASTEVALSSSALAELAQSAKDEAAAEAPASSNFSLRAGVLAYDGNPLAGNNIDVIVMASAFENSYFDRPFDADAPRSPVCFALSEDGVAMAPHDNSLHKQHPQCDGCPRSEWGSDPNGGRGKACKEVRRLTLMPTDGLAEPAKAPLGNLRIPVTSVRNWSTYVHLLAATVKRPPWAVITNVSVKPNVKTQFQVDFEHVGNIDSTEQLTAIKAVRDKAFSLVTIPYTKAEEDEGPQVQVRNKVAGKTRK